MVSYLTKSDASEGFTQIIDFLNGSYIQYALTMNPNSYVSYIKQFWTTVAIKHVNDVTRLQALVDKKKVVVTEAAIREVLRLDDAEGVDFLTLPKRVEHLEYDKVAQALEITKLKRRVKKLEKTNKVRVLKLKRLQRVRTSQRVDTSDDTMMDDESNQGRMIVEMDKDDAVVLMDDKEEDKKDKEAKSQVPAAIITVAPTKVVAAPSKRRKGVVIRDPEEESTTSSIIPAKTKSKDKGKGILVEEPKPLKKKQKIEMDEEYARKLHAELNKDIDWDVAIDHVKLKAKEYPVVKRYQSIKRKPQIEAQARKNMMMYLKESCWFQVGLLQGNTKEQIKEEESRALLTINENPAKKAAKRRKLNEEVEDFKRHLEIMPDEDDDVYTEATPLVRKVHVVDYKIIEINNKPYYKIIRADGTHQLYISFLTLLKNFDREDLEALCNCSSLEESKDNTWSSKGQELEATGIMWCAYHNIYNHIADFVSGKKVPTLKVYSRPDVKIHKTTTSRRPA
nr:hypothetical protein [Tanacetum cinerariifolium]